MRIWTALLAGACAALVSTLVGAAALGLVSATIERESLYDLFLLAWAAMAVLCAVPGKPLGQWLAAVRVSALLLAALCLLGVLTTRDPVTLVVTAVLAGLLAGLGHALAEPGSPRKARASGLKLES